MAPPVLLLTAWFLSLPLAAAQDYYVTDEQWLFGTKSAYSSGVLLEVEGNTRFRRQSPTYSTQDFNRLRTNLNTIAPEGQNINKNQYQTELEAGEKSLLFLNDSEVRMTFIQEGAGYQNSLGYVAWDPSDTTIPVPEVDPAAFRTWVDVNKAFIIPFPRIDSRFLPAGATIQLEYYLIPGNPYTLQTTFPAGSRMIFYLFPNAWNGMLGGPGFKASNPAINYGYLEVLCSVSELNKDGLLHVVTFLDETVFPPVYVYGFEDIRRPGGDSDLEDVQFFVEVFKGAVANADTFFSTSNVNLAVATDYPSEAPTSPPSVPPTPSPTGTPSVTPTTVPTEALSDSPSQTPSVGPTATPTTSPSKTPTVSPSASPTESPTDGPTVTQSLAPSMAPSAPPTGGPTITRSVGPSAAPSLPPSSTPSASPSAVPSALPTAAPSSLPSAAPSNAPTGLPTGAPSQSPSAAPSRGPTAASDPPSAAPTAASCFDLLLNGDETDTDCGGPLCPPCGVGEMCVESGDCSSQVCSVGICGTMPPTLAPSVLPSAAPSLRPSDTPSVAASSPPSAGPSVPPSTSPSASPSVEPTPAPVIQHSEAPSGVPSENPSGVMSAVPTSAPSVGPTASPTTAPPSQAPSRSPSVFVSEVPSTTPTSSPPSSSPSAVPTELASGMPTGSLSEQPSSGPSQEPSVSPSAGPTQTPQVVLSITLEANQGYRFASSDPRVIPDPSEINPPLQMSLETRTTYRFEHYAGPANPVRFRMANASIPLTDFAEVFSPELESFEQSLGRHNNGQGRRRLMGETLFSVSLNHNTYILLTPFAEGEFAYENELPTPDNATWANSVTALQTFPPTMTPTTIVPTPQPTSAEPTLSPTPSPTETIRTLAPTPSRDGVDAEVPISSATIAACASVLVVVVFASYLIATRQRKYRGFTKAKKAFDGKPSSRNILLGSMPSINRSAFKIEEYKEGDEELDDESTELYSMQSTGYNPYPENKEEEYYYDDDEETMKRVSASDIFGNTRERRARVRNRPRYDR